MISYDVDKIYIERGNFIEDMACIGGCIGGAGCLTHGEKNKIEVDKHGKQSKITDIKSAVGEYEKNK